jgi:hypothetical protein
MKKVILSLVMLLLTAGVFAQEQDVPNPAKVRIPSGYQGFLEYGNNWTVFDKEMPNTIGLSTTHGFYFNGHMFAGIGLGIDACREFALVPIYANLRYVISNKSTVSPFMSLRLGSYISEQVGAYGDFAFGVRFASQKDFAVSIMVAATYYDKMTYTDWEDYQDADGIWQSNRIEKTVNPSSVSLRIGIEW